MEIAFVDEGQNLMDMALQYMGDDTDGLWLLAMANGYSLTEGIHPGQSVKLPDPINAGAVNYFAEKGIVIATETTNVGAAKPGGIGYMIIETDFIVT